MSQHLDRGNESIALGISMGFGAGSVVGVVLWLVTGSFVWYPVFVGVGLVFGVAAALALSRRHRRE